ncbi:MAG: hypothetical protein BWK79_12115 [Beggiatoa sp. IS2]|nr:MAG: hypothetical protein BWK79_12115 [Beggiatoa sp. IS2]
MKQRVGICRNYGSCHIADENRKILLSTGKCPECGGRLQTISHHSALLQRLNHHTAPSPLRVVLIMVIVAILSMGGVLLWPDLVGFSQSFKFEEASLQRKENPHSIGTSLENQEKLSFSYSDCSLPQLPLSPVLAIQDQKIPDYLKPWMKNFAQTTITTPAFLIMNREVTVGEFGQYVETLSEARRAQLGTAWQYDKDHQGFAPIRPVSAIPWWAAQGYADWLSQRAHCTLTLPTSYQWAAAAIQYAKPEEAVVRYQQENLQPQSREEIPLTVVDLLGNLREWSQERCGESGYYVLGEDYKTWKDNILGEPLCEKRILEIIGFRLVLQK